MMSSKERTWVGFRSGIPGIALLLMVAFVGLGSAASAFASNTYYVSKSAGSDTNAGTSKSAPWAHAPGMASWRGSHTPVAGDTFILMGCDVWVNSDFPISWNGWSGSSGSPITVGGEDKTWYNTTNCPSGWNRPVFNAQKTVMGPSNGGFNGNGFINPIAGADPSYVTFDNIEFTQLECTASKECHALYNWGTNSTNDYFTNNYVHAWDSASGTDNCLLLEGPYGSTATNNYIYYEYNVIDGSDQTVAGSAPSAGTGACDVFYTDISGAHILNNVIRYVVNPFVGYGTVEIGGNLMEYGLSSIGDNHCNMIETEGGTFYIHDNVIRNYQYCGGGETLWVANANNEVDYVWNNVIYNLGTATPPVALSNTSGNRIYFWNNTIALSQSGFCLSVSSGRTGSGLTLYFENNHCINTGSAALDPTFSSYGTVTNTNNRLQTPSAADANSSPHYDQYTSSQTSAYFPVASANSTVGAGTNLTSSWASGYSTNDTQYGVTEQTVNGVVQAVLGRTSNSRASTGAWDAGAYQYGNPPAAPNPPTGLAAVVH